MAKFSDTVILHVNRYSDTTKQIKRFIYESVLDTGRAPSVAAICATFGLPRGDGSLEPSRPRGRHHHRDAESRAPSSPRVHGAAIAGGQRFAGAGRDLLRAALRQLREPSPHRSSMANRNGTGSARSNRSRSPISSPARKCGSSRYVTRPGMPVAVIGRDGLLLDYQPKSLRIHWGRPFGQWLSTEGAGGRLHRALRRELFLRFGGSVRVLA